MTSDMAIRVDHSRAVPQGCCAKPGQSMRKRYPSTPLRAGHLGSAQSCAGASLRSQRHNTPSTRLRTRLRDAMFLV